MPELTPRQQELVNLLQQGTTATSDLAQAMQLSPRTVKSLLHRLYEKFGIRYGLKRTQLIMHVAEGLGPKETPMDSKWCGTPAASLSRTEMVVLSLVVCGMKNTQIAFLLGTTECVIKNVLRYAGDKIGLGNRVDLGQWWFKNGTEILTFIQSGKQKNGSRRTLMDKMKFEGGHKDEEMALVDVVRGAGVVVAATGKGTAQ